eukprot:COSAG01_NODE_8240_length_2857_cov_2.810145_2_plen_42_part_00
MVVMAHAVPWTHVGRDGARLQPGAQPARGLHLPASVQNGGD